MINFRDYVNELKSTKVKIEDILNKYMRVENGPMSVMGYAEFAEDEYSYEPAVKQNKDGYSIFVEFQAENKKDAKKIAKKVSTDLKNLLGQPVKVDVEDDIWGVGMDMEETPWYVTIKAEVNVPV